MTLAITAEVASCKGCGLKACRSAFVQRASGTSNINNSVVAVLSEEWEQIALFRTPPRGHTVVWSLQVLRRQRPSASALVVGQRVRAMSRASAPALPFAGMLPSRFSVGNACVSAPQGFQAVDGAGMGEAFV